jgi:hypothetical protein
VPVAACAWTPVLDKMIDAKAVDDSNMERTLVRRKPPLRIGTPVQRRQRRSLLECSFRERRFSEAHSPSVLPLQRCRRSTAEAYFRPALHFRLNISDSVCSSSSVATKQYEIYLFYRL